MQVMEMEMKMKDRSEPWRKQQLGGSRGQERCGGQQDKGRVGHLETGLLGV